MRTLTLTTNAKQSADDGMGGWRGDGQQPTQLYLENCPAGKTMADGSPACTGLVTEEDDQRTSGKEIWRRRCGQQDTIVQLEEDGGGSTEQSSSWRRMVYVPTGATKEKGKERKVGLYSTYRQYTSTTKRSDVDHTELYLQIHHIDLPFLHTSIR